MSLQPRMDLGGEIGLPDRLARAEAEVSALKASLERRTAELAAATETLRFETEERRRAEAVLRRVARTTCLSGSRSDKRDFTTCRQPLRHDAYFGKPLAAPQPRQRVV